MVTQQALHPDGPVLSEILFGTWRILEEPSPSPADLAARFERCVELGITSIDTAEIYGGYSVEAAVGAGLAASSGLRDRMQIVTKCGIDVPSEEKKHATLPHYNATAANLVACAEKSLRLLDTDRIDLFLVHRPDWLCPAAETAAGLHKLVDSGKVLAVGVSNYTPSQFDLLQSCLDVPISTNQVEVSLLAMEALDDGTLAQAEQHGRRPMAWSPLGGGRLFDSGNEAGQRLGEVMDALSEKYGGADRSALAFAWVMALPSRPLPILGTNRIERVESAAKAASIRLDPQDWYALWQAAKGDSVP